MSMQDPISDLLTRVRNAQRARHADVTLPASKTKLAICKVLQSEGYVGEVSVEEGKKPTMTVELRYHQGKPVIEELHRVSRPGLRIYKGAEDLDAVRGGLGIAVVSTNEGLMTDRAARAKGVGGEVLCTVF